MDEIVTAFIEDDLPAQLELVASGGVSVVGHG